MALAEVQRELGLPIAEEQIEALRSKLDEIPYERASEFERRFRHDVMAHVHAYGEQCPEARGILHLGATSCYVGDNTDLLILREALDLLHRRVIQVVRALRQFAWDQRAQAALGFTHFQPAQPVTLGKRACLWIQDLLMDLEELEGVRNQLRLLGCKGTTGTQASFLTLFHGDGAACRELDQRIAERMGFPGTYPVSGQTYSRKVDDRIFHCLTSLAESTHKFANDLRLLQHLKEVEEPFEKQQIGSSAMAYKRNPMRCERMTALARFILSLSSSPAMTASEQWLERTLDDSANRRLVLAEGFLAADACLRLYQNVASGLVVYPQMCRRHLEEELPFMASETLLMQAVERGGDRQILHEIIRTHAQAAAEQVKLRGGQNDLLDRLDQDPEFPMQGEELRAVLNPEAFTGRSLEQVLEFLDEVVDPLLQRFSADVPDAEEAIQI